MKPGSSKARLAALLPLLGCAWLGGCSYLRDTFSQTPAQQTQDKVHAALPVGTTMDEAEARLASMNFACQPRAGTYIDEFGKQRSAERFLSCTRRAGLVGFNCENRDQVYVVPNNGVVDQVAVVRGPDCTNVPTGPTGNGGVSNIPK